MAADTEDVGDPEEVKRRKQATTDAVKSEDETETSTTAGEEEDDDEDEEDEDEDDGEEDEPKLKHARLTSHLGSVYRNGDATSAFLVAGDKMVWMQQVASINAEC